MSRNYYRPLNDASKEIRLLKSVDETVGIVDPGDESDNPTAWTIVHEKTGTASSYHALSYTWDLTDMSCSVFINDINILISRNLHLALRECKATAQNLQEPQPWTLWVDALCINQQDSTEKAVQVEQMRAIYERAASVMVWLGDADDSSDWAMRRIHQLSQKAADCELWEIRLGSWPNIERRGDPLGNQRAFKLKRHLEDLVEEDKSGAALWPLWNLMNRRWWDRLWTLQEIAVSANPTIICGKLAMTWRRFRLAFEMLEILALCLEKDGVSNWDKRQDFAFLHGRIARAMFVCDNFDTSKDMLLGFKRLRLKDLLVQTSCYGKMQVTDDRDRVFALLGVATDRQALQIKVDYTKPVEEIYREVAILYLTRGYNEGRLNLLSYCMRFPDNGNSSLPSWVPDWRRPMLNPLSSTGGQDKEGRYSRENNAFVGDTSLKVDEDGKHILTLVGHQYGKVINCGQVYPLADSEEKHIELIKAWLKQFYALSATGSPALSSAIARHEAVWRSAIADWEFGGTQNRLKRAEGESTLGYKILSGLTSVPRGTSLQEQTAWVIEQSRKYRQALGWTALKRKAFVTSGGRLGLGPETMEAGDRIVTLNGCDVPLALRKEGERYSIIGEIYVHGMMDCEERRERRDNDMFPALEKFQIC